MNALILGATGLVGRNLWVDWVNNRGWNVTGTYFRHPVEGLDPLDMRYADAIKTEFDRTKPEVVVIASANPHVDYCELHAEETRRLNVDATIQTAQIAKERGVKVVFFSTEYVFPGRKTPYDEKTPTKPLSEYGRQKVEVEKWMTANLKDYLILRICGVYGWALPFSRKNYVMQVLNSAADRKEIAAATDVTCNPTYAWNLGPVLAELLEKNARGIYHAAGEQAVSRYEFVMDIVDVFRIDRRLVKPINYKTLSSLQTAKRPQHAAFNTDKIKKAVKARLWGPRQALEHMKLAEKEWNP